MLRGVVSSAEGSDKSRAIGTGATNVSVTSRIVGIFGVTIASYVGVFYLLPRALSYLSSSSLFSQKAVVGFAGVLSIFCSGKFIYDPSVVNFLSVALATTVCVGSFFVHPIPICILSCLMIAFEELQDFSSEEKGIPRRLISVFKTLLAIGVLCFNSVEVFALFSLMLGLDVLVGSKKKGEKTTSIEGRLGIEGLIFLAMLFFYFGSSSSSGAQPREWLQRLMNKLHVSDLSQYAWFQQMQNFFKANLPLMNKLHVSDLSQYAWFQQMQNFFKVNLPSFQIDEWMPLLQSFFNGNLSSLHPSEWIGQLKTLLHV